MYFDYNFIKNMFSRWERITLDEINEAIVKESEDSLSFRIKKLSLDFKETGKIASKPDLIVLLRQLLMKQKANSLANDLMVPTQGGWPTIDDWNKFSFQVTQNASQYNVKPKEWRPDWLLGPNRKDDIFLELLEDDYNYSPKEFRIELFLGRATGYKNYKSIVQREALRSMLLMPKGSTLIVNIPTGTGKTLLAQAEFLRQTDRPDIPLTVVVVPTTSLAIDLERRTKEILKQNNKEQWLNHNFAFYSGMVNQEQVRNKIKKHIRSGTQGILFASPESIVRSFSPSLFDAVKSNNLSHFIVDEAHMICEWGDDFRCEYQLLPGLRRGLLKHCEADKFRTVLMAATLTPANLSTLEELFRPQETVQILSGVSLRTEPTYWSNFAGSKIEKDERLDETLRHVPRPFILYMSKPGEVKNYAKHLRENQKYKRIAEFHGGTKAKDRKRIIEQWQNNEIDGIIANSAFGLGIDKSDVRSVIHGSLPESLDRFYQEVGRGGRDGKPSASICIYCEEDIDTANALAEGSVIGTQRAFVRWSTMWNKKNSFGNDLWVLRYSTPPADLNRETEKTEAWNLKIINSLSRTGLIETDFEPMDHAQIELFEGPDEAKQEFRDKEWEKYHKSVFIRIKDEQHLNKLVFSEKLQHLWDEEERQAKNSIDKLLKALRGDNEMGEILSSLYADSNRRINVSKSCRGCPGEDNDTTRKNVIRSTIITPIKDLDKTLCKTKKWLTQFGGDDITEVHLFYEREQLDNNKICELIQKLVKEFGVRCILFSDIEIMEVVEKELIENYYFNEILFFGDINTENDQMGGLLQIPTAKIYHPKEQDPLPGTLGDLSPFPSVTVVPSDIKSHMSQRTLFDDVPNKTYVESFLQWQS